MAANGHGDPDARPPGSVEHRLQGKDVRDGGLADDSVVQHAPQLAGVARVGDPFRRDDAPQG